MAEPNRDELIRVLRFHFGQTVCITGTLLEDLEAAMNNEHVHDWQKIDNWSSTRKCAKPGCDEVGWYLPAQEVK